MVDHARFYASIDSVWTTEEGKERTLEQCSILSAQVEEMKEMVEDVEIDVMVTCLDYDGRCKARLAVYTVEETIYEMENRRSVTTSIIRASAHISSGRAV